MKISKQMVGEFDTHKVEFDSINEFYEYIKKTPTNKVFSDADADAKQYGRKTALSSQSTERSHWYGTSSFDEAVELLKNGVPDTSEKLTKLLKTEKKLQPVQTMKRVNGIQGFQPIVPLYLMGVPNNMISTQMKPVKQKVVSLYVRVSYLCDVSAEKIAEECVKKFRLVTKLESQNYRVNLFLLFDTKSRWDGKMNFMASIKLKGANERLNISKLAFPLTHPSMQRRLLFRLVEVYPDMVRGYTSGYGTNVEGSMVDASFDGFVLPNFITKDVTKISTLEELKDL